MKNFYVIGNNASRSLSPIIFNYWFKKYKLKASYGFKELNSKSFNPSIKNILKDENTFGLNITIPFKTKILKHLDTTDIHAKKINAVNCIVKKTKISGINTDWLGYFKTLPKTKNINKKRVLLVGYGGAALAIHYVLKKEGFKDIIIVNRTKKKIRFQKNSRFTKNINDIHKYLSVSDIIINTIPKNPIHKKNIRLVRKDTLLSDIVYSPKETAFLKSFPNNKKIYGISMLLQQAIPCFNLWFGFRPKIDSTLLEILNRKIK